jgi:hypothetical protein
MNTKTIVLAMVVVAAIAALATAPTALNANADQPRDCFHKGTGDEIDCDDEKGNNASSCNRGGQQCRDD